MTIAEILEKLQQNNIELWNEGDDLRFRAPKGALTPELRNLIVTRKPELLSYLRGQSQQAITYSPLSFGQQSMWVTHQMSPASAAYNVAFPARICSPVVVDVLRRTLQTMVDRHPLLRTTYLLKDSVPVQALHGTVGVSLETIDASGMTPDALDEAIKLAYEQPFDLEHGPILRT